MLNQLNFLTKSFSAQNHNYSVLATQNLYLGKANKIKINWVTKSMTKAQDEIHVRYHLLYSLEEVFIKSTDNEQI